MFPGVDGFHWSFGHVLFLGLFFAIALTIAGTVVRSRLEQRPRLPQPPAPARSAGISSSPIFPSKSGAAATSSPAASNSAPAPTPSIAATAESTRSSPAYPLPRPPEHSVSTIPPAAFIIAATPGSSRNPTAPGPLGSTTWPNTSSASPTALNYPYPARRSTRTEPPGSPAKAAPKCASARPSTAPW